LARLILQLRKKGVSAAASLKSHGGKEGRRGMGVARITQRASEQNFALSTSRSDKSTGPRNYRITNDTLGRGQPSKLAPTRVHRFDHPEKPPPSTPRLLVDPPPRPLAIKQPTNRPTNPAPPRPPISSTDASGHVFLSVRLGLSIRSHSHRLVMSLSGKRRASHAHRGKVRSLWTSGESP
jgi:hypothetical protein